MTEKSGTVAVDNKIKTFRWFFYISLLQLLAYFIVPIFIWPSKFIYHIELISALTLGLIVGLFFLLTNVAGFLIDISRRPLHIGMFIFIGLWFLWATISWSYIEHMNYILR